VSVRVGTALDIGAQLQEPSGAFAHPTLIQHHIAAAQGEDTPDF
jgi:hypothetical protein